MATVKISALTAASTIDGTNDYFPIVTASLNATQKINRATFLGVSGSPMDISTAQTVSNKTINSTNTITVNDTLFTLQNTADNTKRVRFQLSGIGTGLTRTISLPNGNFVLATTTGTETLSNKTLSSPVITGGSIDNTTITVDSISGHTTSTVVSVAGVQLNNGQIGTAGAVVTNSIADSAVTPAKLQAGTGTGWSWASWTPTLTNMTLGNGTIVARFIQIGKTVFFRFTFVLGSTSTIGSSPTFSLPVTAITGYTTGASTPIGIVHYEHTGVTNAEGAIYISSTTTASFGVWGAASTYVTGGAGGLSSSVPFTWAVSDQILTTGFYEAA